MSGNLELKVIFSASDRITAVARAASKEVKAARNAMKSLADQQKLIDNFRSTNKSFGINTHKLEEARAKVKQIADQMAATAAPSAQLQRAFAEARKEAANLSANVNRLTEKKQRLRGELAAVGTDTKQLAAAQRELKGKIDLATGAVKKQEDALDAANRSMKRLKGAQADLAKAQERIGKLRSAGTGMAIGGGAMLAAEMVPIKAFAEAEDSATQLRVALMKSGGAVSEEFVEVNALAERLGNRLPGTTSDFQNMMTMLVRQGMPAKTILGGLGEATALLGVQLKMPMEASAEFAAKLQDATRTTEKDMLGLMDVIQRTFYLGVDQNNMLEAFKGLGPVMDMIKNKGLEGTKALAPFVVMMDQAGMRGESAGNAIRKVVSRSLDVGNIRAVMGGLKKSKGIDLNLDFTNGKGEFGGIDRMMAELSKLKRFDTVTRLSILKDIYGDDKETNEVLSKIIEQGKDGYSQVIAKMGAQANLQERVNTQLGTLKNLWDAASGTFTNATVAFGEAISPELKSLTEWIGSTAEATQRWAREHPELSRALMLTVGGVGILLVTLGGLALAASAILGPFAMARFAFTALGISGASMSGILAGGFGLIMKGVGALGTALLWVANLALAHPVLALITAIAMGAFLIWKNWDTIGPRFFALIDKISTYFGGLKDRAIEAGRNMIDGMISGITSRWDALKTTVTGIGDKSVGWIKEKLGIHSPSQVFAELGGYVMQGFQLGMSNGEDGPLAALGSMSKRLAAIGAGVVISGSAAAGGTMPSASGMAVTINIYAAPGQGTDDIQRQVEQAMENVERRRQARQRSRLRDTE